MSDTDIIEASRPQKTRDLGTFLPTDPLPREVRECQDEGHVMDCREFPGYFLNFCRTCGIRLRVLIDDDEDGAGAAPQPERKAVQHVRNHEGN